MGTSGEFSDHHNKDFTDSEAAAPTWVPDPADHNEIDFSTRWSYENPIQFDAAGRPRNPHATPEHADGRGEIGWGPQHAEDAVAISMSAGIRRILLVQRQSGEWALPGGFVDTGEEPGAAAKRELKEETGIDFSNVPAKTLYQGYVDDPRNTAHAWMETRADLLVVHHMPEPQPDLQEVRDARWFEAKDVASLVEQTGSLYASHGDIVKDALADLDSFHDTISNAQLLHGMGKFVSACKQWQNAADMTVDPLEKGRALRGDAASAARLGYKQRAAKVAKKAYDIHDQAVHEASDEQAELPAKRERAQSANVLGTLLVGATARLELSWYFSRQDARENAQDGLKMLNSAIEDVLAVESVTGQTDQYKINLMSRLAIAHSLYGDTDLAKDYTKQARALAWQSESKQLPTRANLTAANAWRARARAVPQSIAATAVHQLTTAQGYRRRTTALRLATKAGF